MNTLEMKHVGLRQFQRNLYSHIQDVASQPLVITKDRVPFYVFLTHEEYLRLANNQKPQGEIPLTPLVDDNGQPNNTFFQKVKNALSTKIA